MTAPNPGTCPKCHVTYGRADFTTDGMGRLSEPVYHRCATVRPVVAERALDAGPRRRSRAPHPCAWPECTVILKGSGKWCDGHRWLRARQGGYASAELRRANKAAKAGEVSANRKRGTAIAPVPVDGRATADDPTFADVNRNPEPIAPILERVMTDICLRCEERQASGRDDFCAECRVELEAEVIEMAGELP